MARWKVVLPILVVGLILTACPPKQIPEIAEAQSAIDAAVAAGAEQYAPTKLNAARDALAAAESARQSRNYNEAVAQAELAKRLANEARADALEAARRAQEQPTEAAAPTEAAPVGCGDSYKVVYFDFDSSVIKADYRGDLDAAASCLKNSPDTDVTVTGYCDPRGTDDYNMALGERRALAVKTYLQNSGVSGDRIKVISKGESELLDPSCSSESCWSKERRGVLQ